MTAPWMQPSDGGVSIDLWVVPGASRTELVGVHGSSLKVRVAAPPERGKANSEVERLFRRLLAPATVDLVAGATRRSKRLRVVGLDPDAVARRLLP